MTKQITVLCGFRHTVMDAGKAAGNGRDNTTRAKLSDHIFKKQVEFAIGHGGSTLRYRKCLDEENSDHSFVIVSSRLSSTRETTV